MRLTEELEEKDSPVRKIIKETEIAEILKKYNHLKLIEKLRNQDIQNKNDNKGKGE